MELKIYWTDFAKTELKKIFKHLKLLPLMSLQDIPVPQFFADLRIELVKPGILPLAFLSLYRAFQKYFPQLYPDI